MACKCPDCWSLAEYMQQLTGSTFGLAPAKGHSTAPLVLGEPCEGSMTCECTTCRRERSTAVQRGVREVRQPWDIAA